MYALYTLKKNLNKVAINVHASKLILEKYLNFAIKTKFAFYIKIFFLFLI
jgi:hypothetical protein